MVSLFILIYVCSEMLNPMLVTALIVTGEERRGCCSFERSTEKKTMLKHNSSLGSS
jgi:hypothetical protein